MPDLDPQAQRQFAMDVVRTLRAGGFEAYWAGGCVRDQLLGREPKDYDVATSARPAEIREAFRHRHTLEVGAAFGVVVVLGPKQAGQIDVTTFRQDAQYSDGRHPDAVSFSTPEQDALRRDFTINGLFFDPLSENVIDFVGGQEDLQQGIIRAIGDPQQRFAEDKLRLLRAIRFATAFDFAIEPGTLAAIAIMADQVTVVSPERIAAELRLMMVHPRRAQAAALLADTSLLRAILPEVGPLVRPSSVVAEDAWQHTLRVLENLEDPLFPVALAALAHRYLNGKTAEDVCRRLRLSTRETRSTAWLVENQSTLTGAAQLPWPKLQPLLVSPAIEDLLKLTSAVVRAESSSMADVEHCRRLLELPRDQLDPPPLVTGDDLIAHGVREGHHYQQILQSVRDAQLEKRIHSKQEALQLVDQLWPPAAGTT